MREQVGRNSVGRGILRQFPVRRGKARTRRGERGFGEITGRGTGCVRGEWEDSRETCESGIGIEGGLRDFGDSRRIGVVAGRESAGRYVEMDV